MLADSVLSAETRISCDQLRASREYPLSRCDILCLHMIRHACSYATALVLAKLLLMCLIKSPFASTTAALNQVIFSYCLQYPAIDRCALETIIEQSRIEHS